MEDIKQPDKYDGGDTLIFRRQMIFACWELKITFKTLFKTPALKLQLYYIQEQYFESRFPLLQLILWTLIYFKALSKTISNNEETKIT